MKYVKMFGLLALAGVALMAFASSASATTLTGANGNVLGVGTIITAESEEGAIAGTKHVVLTGPLGINIQCESHVEGEVTNAGGTKETETVEGKITTLSFFSCTNGIIVDVKSLGTLSVHTTTAGVSNGNGTVTSTGTTVEVTNTPVGTCGYTTGAGTDLGDITGAPTSTGHATFDITASITRHSGSSLCGSAGTWEGNYTVTTPKGIRID